MIRTQLMSHQQQIVDFCYESPQAGIFSDYGTGKTLALLALVGKLRANKVLVVSTKLSIQSTWPDEIRRHTDFRFIVLIGTQSRKRQLMAYGLRMAKIHDGPYNSPTGKTVLFLVNYDGVRNLFHEIVQSKFDLVVLDESTKIKSISTRRTKVIMELNKYIMRRYVMTGFPVTENVSDLYAQVKFLDKGLSLGTSFYGFLDSFFVRIGVKLLPKRASVRTILTRIKPFCIRITNKMLKLPPKIYKMVPIDMTPQQTRLLNELNESFMLEFGKVQIDTQYVFTLITRSLQICDGFITDQQQNIEVLETGKDEMLLELLEEIDLRKNKVVIWCAFLFSIMKLKRILSKMGHNVLTLTGHSTEVNQIVHTFQHSPKHQILIATQKKAAESITLTACKHAVYYSNVWSYDLRGNSEARICRKGSEHHASIIYTDLFIKDSVEEKVYECLIKKRDLINEMKKEFLTVQHGGRKHGKQ